MPIFTRKPDYRLLQPAHLPQPMLAARPGLYHLTDDTSPSDLLYLLHQIMGSPPPLSLLNATDYSPPGLSIARLPHLDVDMLEHINDFHGAVLLLSAASAHRLHLVQVMAEFLTETLDLQPAMRWRLETVLHEALSNAIHHGSLELPPISSDALTTERLADPDFGGRMLAFGWQVTAGMIECFIMDQGPGFDAPMVIGKDAPSYKGLSLLRSLSHRSQYSHNGRCLDFTVSLTA